MMINIVMIVITIIVIIVIIVVINIIAVVIAIVIITISLMTIVPNRDIVSPSSQRPALSTDASLEENITTLQHQVKNDRRNSGGTLRQKFNLNDILHSTFN